MDERVVQVCRAIACRARLRILTCLAREQEVSPTRLQHSLRMPLPTVSAHLRRLEAVGLIQRRRSGVRCYGVARAADGADAFAARVAFWLFQRLRDPRSTLRDCRVEKSPRMSDSQAQDTLHALVFEAATAFSHLRRLALARHLIHQGAADGEALADLLRMSPAALSRHTRKLIRRAYVQAERSAGVQVLKPTPDGRTHIHGEMWGLVFGGSNG